MGYDLYARHKSDEHFQMGAFSFSWLLDSGVGLVIGYQRDRASGGFIFTPRSGKCPSYNDGFRVTAAEARAMALAARGLVECETYRYEKWEAIPAEQRAEIEKRFDDPRIPIRKDFLEKASRFADWAEKSGGFAIR